MFAAWSWPNALWLGSYVLLWLLALFLGFLLLGALRSLGLLQWKLLQLEATTPSRLGRNGLKPGKKAPEFTLPWIDRGQVALRDFAGRKVLLVFTQSGCGPCHEIMPELNALSGGAAQVLVVNKGARGDARLATELGVRFPVLVQDGLKVSKKYEAFATPFAFLIDEKGIVASRGIVLSKEHIGYVLSGAGERAADERPENEQPFASKTDAEEDVSHSAPFLEVQHV